MDDELKPCPVCGGECELNEESSDGVWTYIECKTKGCQHSVSGFGKKEIIEFHNDRYPRIGTGPEDELKPCPVCGGECIAEIIDDVATIFCDADECSYNLEYFDCHTPLKDVMDGVIKDHNAIPRIGPADDECTRNMDVVDVWEYDVGRWTVTEWNIKRINTCHEEIEGCQLEGHYIGNGKWTPHHSYEINSDEFIFGDLEWGMPMLFPSREAAAKKLKEIRPDWKDESK